MVEPYLRRSALAHKSLSARASESHPDAGVSLGESPFRCMINLRGNAGDAAFAGAVQRVLGVDLPTMPNTVNTGAGVTVFWLGPDEWLVVGSPGREETLVKELRESLAGQHVSIVDVSEARTVIVVTGRRAQDALQKGTPIDLHPRVFQAGHCAQTGLSKANVILHRLSDEPRFEVYVTISFADYLWNWLERAADEYGLAVVEP
ncbi:MAG: sarcosine oxidase subunit gamma [Bryobacteraceae bacterium]